MYSFMLTLLPLMVQEGQAAPKSSAPSLPPVTTAIRLGAQLSPRFSFVGGLDVDFNRLSLGPGWSSRLDLEALSEPRSDGFLSAFNTTLAATFNQIYAPYYRHYQRRPVYVGFGIGYYGSPEPDGTSGLLGNGYRNVGHFGGKVFIGSQFTSTTSAEIGIHFPGVGTPLVAAQLRLKL
jgi:hypothetical protein